jgi:phage tail sheath protein FI
VFVPPLAYGVGDHPQGLASAFVQLVYPWVRTPGSLRLPGQLESPEGVLIGLLARNALTRGSFRSAAGLPLADVNGLEPTLTRAQLFTPHGQPRPNTLLERVSLLGPTPAGLRLLSDVTTSLSDSYRPASVNRLVTAIVRAARSLGEAVSFEPAAESLWNRLKSDLDALLLGLWQAGALAGASPGQAFSVRCDRTTTRQADLDNGRVIAEVQFSAAVPIEQIHVVLALSQGGQVSLVSVPP